MLVKVRYGPFMLECILYLLNVATDPALFFQLAAQHKLYLTVGTKWMKDLRPAIEFSAWPSNIPRPPPTKKRVGEDDEGDNVDSATLHEIIEELELDDQHAKFLDPTDIQEEDEVEKLLGKVAEQCEELDIDLSSTEDEFATLFN